MLELDNFDCVIDMVGYHPADAESVVRAFRGRVGHYIFCSTIDVYTKPARSYPIKEDADRSGTFEGYPRDKMLCENILLAAHDPQSFPVTIIRLEATYGDNRGFVHSLGGDTTYIDRLRKGKPIIVHSDGTSIWVNCHVDDVSRAFIGAMGNPRAFGKAYGSCLQPSRTRPRRSRPPGRAAH